MKYSWLLAIALIACQSPGSGNAEVSVEGQIVDRDPTKIYNLMGEELPEKQFSDAVRAKLEQNLSAALNDLQSYPDSLELMIWYGRRLAYLGRYLEAIDVYTSAIKKFPTSHQLRRHRGHRYLSTRQIAKAVEDFEMAAFYAVNHPNAIEPDGIPNKLNKPLSNDKFNIWYHYGLAHYLSGRYDKAISAYKKCMEFSDNPDLIVATTYWLYMTYKKIGNVELADQLLSSVDSKIKLIENDAYLELLLLFKGKKRPEAIFNKTFPAEGVSNPTLGYGLGNWYQQQGAIDKANEVFLKILESPSWDAFGYIAAEAEIATAFPVPIL